MVSFDQIRSTQLFQSLTKIQRKIFLNPNTRRVIQNGVNVVNSIGFKKWKGQTAFNKKNEEVIKELTNNL